jgi:hypothetical protein
MDSSVGCARVEFLRLDYSRAGLRRARLVAALSGARVSITKSHATTPNGADSTFADQLDTHVLERLHNFRQRIHVAAYKSVARFHSLNSRQGQPCPSREHCLVNAKQGAGSTKLRCSYHVLNITIHVSALIQHVTSLTLKQHKVSFG